MKRICVLCILLWVSLLTSGCWDRYELEERANILGLAIDKADQKDMEMDPETTHLKGQFPEKDQSYLKVTAQMAIPGKIKLGPEGGGGQGSSQTAWVLETVGYTLGDAMANFQQQLAERLYLGHLQIIVVSEDIAKEGIREINEFLRRNEEVRRTAWMVVNDKDASKVLKITPPIETVPSLYLSDTLDNAVRFGKLPRKYLGKFWIDLNDVGIDAILPSVKIVENNRILVDGIAFFKQDKLAGMIKPLEIGAYMAMKEKNPGGYSVAVSVKGEEGVYLVQSEERRSNITVSVNYGKPSATIQVEIDAVIEEEVKTNSINLEKISEIEKEVKLKLETLGEGLIRKWQKAGSDVLGIGALVRSQYSGYWNREVGTHEEWLHIYKDMEIEVIAGCNIRRTGMKWK
ncbi:Ger(x)C family spore germination protein [Marinicrinis lubricantis]|uniref:Ger(X)C family spore germination protein n=1 Tax=Marinicrinis lubricantis TaxID=2086470 RepID=A0ABW1ILS4_9BACL